MTTVLTIHAGPNEEHKLFTEDIIAGEAKGKATCDSSNEESRREPYNKGEGFEGGDDLAQEGTLSQEV